MVSRAGARVRRVRSPNIENTYLPLPALGTLRAPSLLPSQCRPGFRLALNPSPVRPSLLALQLCLDDLLLLAVGGLLRLGLAAEALALLLVEGAQLAALRHVCVYNLVVLVHHRPWRVLVLLGRLARGLGRLGTETAG